MKNENHGIKSDEQSLAHSRYLGINWVGMTKIQSCIKDQNGQIPVELDIFVNLLPGQRGIHMSRLYQLQMQFILGKEVTAKQLHEFLIQSIVSQEGIASRAQIKLRYQFLQKTESLKSNIKGFRTYPVELSAEADQAGFFRLIVQFLVTYSSTCPQSAKLSKELFKDLQLSPPELEKWYESDFIFPATPHAQRSHMNVELVLKQGEELHISDWISQIENALQTPVQTAVKKADEMEFARLNAENTMFCEDAVRKIATFLDLNVKVDGYRLTADHLESLHPHNATSQILRNFSL
jgi:GTP cyclohydrolase I